MSFWKIALGVHLGSLLALAPGTALAQPANGLKAAESDAQEVKLGKETLALVRIPAGTFTMGAITTGTAFKDSLPVHKVTLTRAFWMGKYPVTQGQWEAVMETNPSRFTAAGREAPVEQVSWDDAQRFIARLNALGTPWTFRLPTEAEWEYACRAGDPGAAPSALEAAAWYRTNSDKTTHPVGGKKANAFGLFDMIGNVAQWCQDGYAPYTAEAATDPEGPAGTRFRVVRGNGWNAHQVVINYGGRTALGPEGRFSHLGLRVCATPRP